jgi:hypothetical protein
MYIKTGITGTAGTVAYVYDANKKFPTRDASVKWNMSLF